MKKLAFIFLLLTARPAVALDPLTSADVAGEAAFASLVAVDVMQTRWFLTHPGYEELNPILGSNPSAAKLYLGALGGVVLHAGVTKLLPAKYRPLWRHVSLAVQTGFVGNNIGVTGGLHLTF